METKHYQHVNIIRLLLLSIYFSICNAYYCWTESERHVLKFINNPNKNITHLPTVRLIQGYYPSQFAMQYAAYVYLTEQMGIDVTFFPDNDPDAISQRYDGYDGDWCGFNTSNSSTCSPLAPYPRFYFEDIKNDQYDLLFEMWDVMVRAGDGAAYFKDDSVTHGGISNVYGEGGWFIPKYVYDASPEWLLPQYLKYNETLRQIFIDAYTKHADRDYVARWWQGWGSKLDDYHSNSNAEPKYETPNYSKPIVFGSYEGYATSRYSNDLVHNLLGGINWTFAAFGSEANLTEFVVDLYSKELPFIASLYSPHQDFATKLPDSSGYMQFERVVLPRNPNNDVDDVCYENGQCAFPLSPLLKIGNPKLLAQFVEMYSFLLDFKMSTTDVNDIIAYNIEAGSYDGLSKHEMWINASCKWLKQKQAITDEWFQDIVRYDCIFDDVNQSNCGFNYYYTTIHDAIAMDEEHAIMLPWYGSVAANCSNSTNEPKCNCYSDYFEGSTCRDSCRGVIGPIQGEFDHGFNNESIINVGNFTIIICNGHGICDMRHKTCLCDAGFGGDACEIVFAVFSYSTGLIVLFCILFFICLVVLFVSIWWVHNYRQYKTIKALSPNLTILFTVGLILLCIGAILYLFHPLSDVLCISRMCFYGIGSILTIMAPLCKTYRVAIIFAQAMHLKRINIPDKKLLIYLLAAVVIEAVVCLIYAIVHEISGGVGVIYWKEFNRVEYVCNDLPQYILAANFLYIFMLIVILCFFSFKNRNTYKIFKESRCAYFGSFFALFVFVVVVVFNVVVDDIAIVITMQSGAMLTALCVIWVLFYGQRMYRFYMYPDGRSTVILSADNNTKTSKNKHNNYTPSFKEYNKSIHSSEEIQGSEMPSYINELYKQRGFESTTPTNNNQTATMNDLAGETERKGLIKVEND